MKKFANLFAPITFGFAVTAAFYFAAPGSLAFVSEDSSHIFETGRTITVEIPTISDESA